MKNLIKAFVVIMILITNTAFTNHDQYDFIGTYGVSGEDPAQIKLTINENRTFTYQDFSNPNNKIDVKGQWELKGKTVMLKDPNTSYTFHNKWTFADNGQIAKSRKGVTFYRLCRLEISK